MSTDTSPGETTTVALAVDDRMVYGALVLAGAIARHATSPPHILLGFFTGELSTRNHALLEDYLTLRKLKYTVIESTPSALFSERRHLTITTFSKFVIADAFPGPHLWLDIDTIVKPGWDDMFSAIYSASADVGLVVAEKIQSSHTRFDGFNAGVLGWTATPRRPWKESLASLPEKRFSSEQFLFNTLYGSDVATVPSSYNFLSSWHAELPRTEDPRIIHYSGPLKPWHLARRHTQSWRGVNATWQFWFDAEKAFLDELPPGGLRRAVVREKRRALLSGRLHTGKGALAGWVMRLLALIGPFGSPLVSLIARRARA